MDPIDHLRGRSVLADLKFEKELVWFVDLILVVNETESLIVCFCSSSSGSTTNESENWKLEFHVLTPSYTDLGAGKRQGGDTNLTEPDTKHVHTPTTTNND